MRRHAFTLIELLIVISIIAVLAGLLIPAVTMIQSKAKDLKCSNNLRQVGIAVMVYRDEHQEDFPWTLYGLFKAREGMNLNGLETKLLVCPKDANKGGSNTMNRGGPLTPVLSELYNYEGGKNSYLYQCSNYLLDTQTQGWFWFDGFGRDITDLITWGDGKRNQQQFGNCSGTDPNVRGAAFPEDLFPVITCFWHQRWSHANVATSVKAQSITWNGSLFLHIPKWEHQVNSVIPP